MKKIKFRGRRINCDGFVWVYGYYYYKWRTTQHIIHCPESEGVLVDQAFEVIPETVGQFTEKKDKNGKDIYWGDICKIYDSESNSTRYKQCDYDKSVIRFYGSAFVYGQPIYGGGLANFYLGNITSDFIEVISNIHENPELIK